MCASTLGCSLRPNILPHHTSSAYWHTTAQPTAQHMRVEVLNIDRWCVLDRSTFQVEVSMQLTQTPVIAQHRLVQTLGYQIRNDVGVTSSTHSKGMCYLYTTTSAGSSTHTAATACRTAGRGTHSGARRSADADHLHSATQRTGPVRLGASR